MKTVGQILKEKRETELLSLGTVVKKTGIPRNYLLAIESDNYEILPRGLYPRLYIRKYASFLGLSGEKMLAFFRRDYQEETSEKKYLISQGLCRMKWRSWLIGGIIFVSFFSYLVVQYLRFVAPSRVRNLRVTRQEGEVLIEGQVNRRSLLRIDGKVVELNPDGRFSYSASKDRKKVVLKVESPTGQIREVTKTLVDKE